MPQTPHPYPERIGMVFGRLTVVGEDPERYVDPKGKSYRRWLAQCSCGNPQLRSLAWVNLKFGRAKSCGCLRAERMAILGSVKVHRREKHNLVGRRFGRWKVIANAPTHESGTARFLCMCDPAYRGCGAIKTVLGPSLLNGDSKSCGCLRAETARWMAMKGYQDGTRRPNCNRKIGPT